MPARNGSRPRLARLLLLGAATLSLPTACSAPGSIVWRPGAARVVEPAGVGSAPRGWASPSVPRPPFPSVVAPLYLAIGSAGVEFDAGAAAVSSSDLSADELTAAAPRTP